MSEQGKQTEVSIQQGTANVGSTIQSNTSGGVSVTGSTVNGNITSNDNRVTNNTYNNGPIQYRCPTPFAAPLKFGGRDRELAELKQRLKGENRVAIASLNGQGGIGKTTLARQLAYDLYHEPAATRSFRAVLWLELTPNPNELTLLREAANQVTQPNSYDLPDGQPWEKLVGEVGRIIQNAIEQHCDECQPERVLVVLDDVWENGVELAQTLLDKLCPPNSTVLVTTRDFKVAARLGVQPGQRQDLAYLGKEDGAKLLAEYLDNLPQPDLETLSEALGGYTLALTLAAKRLLSERNPARALPIHLNEYHQELPAGSPFADLELEQGQRKEENLTRSLQYSYEALTDTEKACFRALGALVSNQPFDLEILAALWQLPTKQTERIHKRLSQLALLEEDTASMVVYKGQWYRQHPVLFSYARALLSEAGELEERQNNYTHFQDQIIEIAHQFNELPPEEWSTLSSYLPYINIIGDYLSAQSNRVNPDISMLRRTLTFANNITRYLLRRREEPHIEEWLQMGLTTARRLNERKDEATFLNELGLYYLDLSQPEEALNYFELALTIRSEIKDDRGKASTLSNIGRVYDSWGNIDKAKQYYEDSLLLRRLAYDVQGEATSLTNLGRSYGKSRDHKQALIYYKQALRLRRQVGDKHGEAVTLVNFGLTYKEQGQYRKALEYYEKALKLDKEVGDQRSVSLIYNRIATIYYKWGRLPEAITNATLCVELQEQLRHPSLARNRERLACWQAELTAREKAQ